MAIVKIINTIALIHDLLFDREAIWGKKEDKPTSSYSYRCKCEACRYSLGYCDVEDARKEEARITALAKEKLAIEREAERLKGLGL